MLALAVGRRDVVTSLPLGAPAASAAARSKRYCHPAHVWRLGARSLFQLLFQSIINKLINALFLFPCRHRHRLLLPSLLFLQH